MGLTEEERKLLEEMERNLYRSESDVVARVSPARLKYRAVILGVLLVALGLAVMITGVLTQLVIVGIAGFLAMFSGVFVAFRYSVSADKKLLLKKTEKRPRRGFFDLLRDRWDRRE